MRTYRIPSTRLGVYLWMKEIRPSEVYEPLGISPSYFSQILWGHRTDKSTYQKIANFLEVELEDIYEGTKTTQAKRLKRKRRT